MSQRRRCICGLPSCLEDSSWIRNDMLSPYSRFKTRSNQAAGCMPRIIPSGMATMEDIQAAQIKVRSKALRSNAFGQSQGIPGAHTA